MVSLPSSIQIRTRQDDEAKGSTRIQGLASIISAETLMQNSISQMLEIKNLKPFVNHPFTMDEAKILEMAESIKHNGILVPIIVRELGFQDYEILAGHRRTEAAKIVGLYEIPANVLKNISDEQAVIIMTETNLKQRDKLLHSEKARAYKMQLEAIKRQGKRTDLLDLDSDNDFVHIVHKDDLASNNNSVHNVHKVDSAAIIAQNNDETKRNIFNYIRLTYLYQELLSMVDRGEIPFRAGVDLSYLEPEEQLNFYTLAKNKGDVKVTLEMAMLLKTLSKEKALTIEKMEEILGYYKEVVKTPYNPYLMASKKVSKLLKTYAESNIKGDEELEKKIVTAVEDVINKILEDYR